MENEFNIVRPQPIFEQIIEHLKFQIANGALQIGDRLPPERKLAEIMGVNRHTVREALKVLEYMGVVEGKTGVGTIVHNVGQNHLADQISQAAEFAPNHFLSELMELRLILEPGIASLAAERVTEEDIAVMNEAMDDFKKEFKNGAVVSDADERLHIALAHATKNSTIVRLTAPILLMLSKYREKSLMREERRAETYREHEKIFLAVKNRRPKEARSAMEFHLEKVKQILKD